MIQTILYDIDGVIIQREMYFSNRLVQDFGIPFDSVLPFFKKEFRLCVTGKADIKKELQKYLSAWGWNKSVEDLLEYWFKSESTTDSKILSEIAALRTSGIQCYLSTDNEKYRTDYLRDVIGLGKSFDGIFSSAELGYTKSQREFWSTVHEKLNKPDPASVFVWDDDQEIVDEAQKFGLGAALYTDFDLYQEKMKLLLPR